MLTYKLRQFLSEIQDPELLFESSAEKEIYYLFRDNFLMPILQKPVGKYFLDFAFPDIFIAIEFDGPSHNIYDQKAEERTIFIVKEGWHIIRIVPKKKFHIFFNYEESGTVFEDKGVIENNLETVILKISNFVKGLRKEKNEN